MSGILSRLGSQVGAILNGRSYWAVKMRDGKWLCELDTHDDFIRGVRTPLEWFDDLVVNGDVLNIVQLWLFCPPHPGNPTGTSAMLPIVEPGTAFQFKGRAFDAFAGQRYPTFQVIGRVTDKQTLACECFIYDYLAKGMSIPYHTTLRDFKPWREGASPVGALALDVIGVKV